VSALGLIDRTGPGPKDALTRSEAEERVLAAVALAEEIFGRRTGFDPTSKNCWNCSHKEWCTVGEL
jgi:hypothetical protein